MKVEFFRHNVEEGDIKKVAEVLKSVFLTTGPVTDDFEKKFSQYTGLKETVGLNSCTAALHLSLLALGIGPGDEVITTPMTFIATATSIMHAGAKPVFVDVEENTGLMDADKVEEAITPRTRATISSGRFLLKIVTRKAHNPNIVAHNNNEPSCPPQTPATLY